MTGSAAVASPPSPSGSARLSRPRAVAFSLLAGVAVLAGLELAARSLEPTDGSFLVDLYSPLPFQQIPDGDVLVAYDGGWTFAPGVIDHDAQAVPEARADRELRVLVVGGSAAAGGGMPLHANLTSVAERALAEALPERTVRVINLARSGYASGQVAAVVDRAIDRLVPDLVVAVIGNNERLEIANIATIEGAPKRVLRARELRRRSALARWIRPPRKPSVEATDAAPHPAARWEVPDRAGVEAYALDRLDRNLRRIAASTRRVGAEFAVATLAGNWRWEAYGHEWYFLGPDVVEGALVREAHLASQYDGFHERVLEAAQWLYGEPSIPELLVLSESRRALGEPDLEAEARLAAWVRERPPVDLDPSEALTAAWIGRLTGPPGEAARRADSLSRAVGDEFRAGQEVCLTADLQWHAGDRERAAQGYRRCFLTQHYYRADADTNDRLRAVAESLGVPVVELEAAVIAHSPHGVPDFRWFHDYCHFNVRGSVLAGHVLAQAMADALGVEATVRAPAAAVAEHDARWAGRSSDHGSIQHWGGVDADLVQLTGQRPLTPVRERDDARRALFEGNRAAQRASPANPEAVAAAEAAWRRALELDPALTAAAENLAWLATRR